MTIAALLGALCFAGQVIAYWPEALSVDSPSLQILCDFQTTSPDSAGSYPRGCGALLSEDGFLVTTFHQTVGAKALWIEDARGERQPATFVIGDPISDAAILHVERPVAASFAPLAVDWIPAPGALVHLHRPIQRQSATQFSEEVEGIIIDVATSNTFGDSLYTDHLVAPGDSGSPLLNSEGHLVGLARGGTTKTCKLTVSVGVSTLRSLLERARVRVENQGSRKNGDQGEAVASLARWGIEIDPTNSTQQRPEGLWLALAASAGDEVVMQWLIDRGVDLNWRDARGANALFYAMERSMDPTALALIRNGIDVSAEDATGRSPLAFAVRSNQRDVIAALLEAGADIQGTDEEGMPILHRATYASDFEIALTLIDHGADVNATNSTGQTALMMSACLGRLLIVDALLRKGATVDLADTNGDTALHHAARAGSGIVIETLVNAGAEIERPGQYGRTPLHNAAVNPEPDCARLLLNHGAAINAKTSCNETALMFAAIYGTAEVVNLLLSRGADPTLRDTRSKTAFDWSFQRADDAGREVRKAFERLVSD